MTGPRLLADVGGTNARFALELEPRRFSHVHVLSCADYPSLAAAMTAYLAMDEVRRAGEVRDAAVAIANPVMGDEVCMTNHHWRFSINSMRNELGLRSLLVINDFAALAMALPHLSDEQRFQVGAGTPENGRALGLVGPGTGLGVAGLVPSGQRWTALPGEGGHASFAPTDRDELRILNALWEEFGHVSAERLLSGPGLAMIHRVLHEELRTPADITRAALEERCPRSTETVERFCAVLGSVAGNVALTLGATGGMYIGGGIVPRLGGLFARSRFRERFEGKGRLSPYLARIPTYVITEPYPAFLGVSALLADHLH
ncbi:MAG TPA: glucokinase [Telluria sp.]|nr:glucokinase [Telluria sp.]